MKILIIGNGGREHAIAWKLAQEAEIQNIYVSPGNAGIVELQKAECVRCDDLDEIVAFALDNDIDLTIVGSEAWLVEGIVDRFHDENLAIFGPHQAAAMLEGSKAFAKDFMKKYKIKTADYQIFTEPSAALSYLENCRYPVVIKASGLAAGKGVVICQTHTEAQTTVRNMMIEKRFGLAGLEIVIEEYLQGFEASVLSFYDGKCIKPMLAAKDHKTIGEHNTGENTGGMGVVVPHPQFTETQYQQFLTDVLQPTLRGLQAENLRFAGVIFFGLMINERGVFLLEYNLRFGDPETQTLLPLMQSSLLTVIQSCLEARLEETPLTWSKQTAVCVVAASQGYPAAFKKGYTIEHIEKARFFSHVFFAGTKLLDGEYLTDGGRVLNVIGLGNSLAEAKQKAYSGIQLITFNGMTYRRDIGDIEGEL